MENGPARLTEISFCSAEISAKRADFFSYDSSSPVSRAKIGCTAHARLEFQKQTWPRWRKKCKKKCKHKHHVINFLKQPGWKTPYDSKKKSARLAELARITGLI